MRGTGDTQLFSNIAATTAGFALAGGNYQLAVVATFGGGTVQLQQLGPDASTWVNTGTGITSAGVTTMQVPPGQYRVSVTTATAVYASVVRIPDE